jgi:predicted PurR-regulated permease PerM
MPQDKINVVETKPSGLQIQSRTTLTTFLVILILGLGLTLRMIWPYLIALVMGGILALLSQPLFKALRKHRFSTKISSSLVTIGILLLIIVPISAFVTVAIKQGITIGQSLAANDTLNFQSIFNKVSQWSLVEKVIGTPEVLERQAKGWVQSAGKMATTAILSVASEVPNLVLQIVLASISCFFFLIDGPKFTSWIGNKIPLDSDVRAKIVNSFENTTISVIWATLAAASVQSAVMLVSFLTLGVPGVFLAAGATFIFAWIPIVGSTPVWVVGALYLYLDGSILKMIFMIASGFFTGIIDNFIRPIVLKGRGNLHPLVSLVAIFGGIEMIGLFGIFLGPVLVAVVISILQIWPNVAQRFGLMSKTKENLPQVSAPIAEGARKAN